MNDFIVDDDGQAAAASSSRTSATKPARSRPLLATNRSAGSSYELASQLGISADAWSQVFELFGDGSDYAYALYPEEDNEEEGVERKIEDVYEPEELADKMFTKTDDAIKALDLPERFQLLGDLEWKEMNFEEIKAESLWIAKRLRRYQRSGALREDLATDNHPIVNAVKLILQFIRLDKLEVPFIQRHRQDYYVSVMDSRELWEVFDLNLRWMRLKSQKEKLEKLTGVIPQLDQLISAIEDEESLNDISVLLRLCHQKVCNYDSCDK